MGPTHLVPRSLRYLEAVLEHGSIQGASRATGISASAIDRQIRLLEDRLEVQLFDRLPSGAVLNPVGEMFVVLSRRWRADERRIASDVKQMQGIDTGHIRLAAMDSLVNGVIPRFLGRVAEDYPRVRIDVEIVTPDGAAAMLDDGQVDLALAFNLKPGRDLHMLWSAELPLFCIVAADHPLSECATLALGEVRNQAIVVQSKALTIRRMLEARHSWIFSDGPPPVVTNSLQLLKQLVVAGRHVALTSELDAAPEIASGLVKAIPIRGSDVSGQTIGLAINPRRTLPKIAIAIADELSREVERSLDEVRR